MSEYENNVDMESIGELNKKIDEWREEYDVSPSRTRDILREQISDKLNHEAFEENMGE